MENNKEQLDALQDIRQMMKKSSKFLSLSGLSGVFAGVYALIGAYFGTTIISNYIDEHNYSQQSYNQLLLNCVVICAAVLIFSIITALGFSLKKAKKTGQKLFDHTALRLFINMFIPLAAGGMFCIALLYHGNSMALLIGPTMLIFYGLALVNGSKYTLHDIRYLGCLQILLGIVASFYLGYGIIFWALGFGVLHIVYGIFMWFKYERK